MSAVRYTYNVPRRKIPKILIFFEAFKFSCHTIGMGMQRMKTSKKRFVISYPRSSFDVSMQYGGSAKLSQCSGWGCTKRNDEEIDDEEPDEAGHCCHL